MYIRLADYVANFLADRGVTDVFSVVGGGAMHLNDAFGHNDRLHVTYNHHEQASAIAAEAYARIDNRIAAVCVTTGPGGTNALTGVVGGWLDSIPMFIVSGQVRYDTTARYERQATGGVLRAVGDQEFDIVQAAGSMCKFAQMLEDPADIRWMLEKAWHLAATGRPGPVWIDIPVNYQGCTIETDALNGYDPAEDDAELPPPVPVETVAEVLRMVREAKRPVLYAGNGLRLSGAYESFRRVADALGVPVVTYFNTIDLIEDAHPLYVGRGGNMGDRPGNFAVQNSDLVLALGTRLSIRQTGFAFESWARAAKVVTVNIDRAEMGKHTVHVDLPVWADVADFLAKAESLLASEPKPLSGSTDWRRTCANWKVKYPVVLPRYRDESTDHVNVYAFIRRLGEKLDAGSLTVVSNGACCVAGGQAHIVKKGSRFLSNSAIASMGYGLPAAIGACIGAGRRTTVCLEGDGSIMMNLQELQTVLTNRLPIKVFLINNQGYQSIRLTQNNLFSGHSKVGIGPDSGDVSFPDYARIAQAFGYPYFSARSYAELDGAIDGALSQNGPAFCEIFTDTQQAWEPKSATRRLADGTLVSAPLEDLAPFLPREELLANMCIPLPEEQ